MTTKTVPIDNLDQANMLSQKLHALLSHTSGESGESFRNLPEELQDNYLWACVDIAGQLRNVVRKMAVQTFDVEVQS